VAGRARIVLIGWLGLVAACGAQGPGPGLTVRQTRVVVESGAPFAARPDFPARLESTIGAALDYWGGTWSDLAGFDVTLTDAPHVACGGAASALGCLEGRSIRLTTTDPGLGELSCVEQTVLVHEVGHAVIQDGLHEDPRWMQLDELAEALSGRTGYSRDGDVRCLIYPSVWRHLPGLP
jgi:hypothetical protein